MDDFIRRSDAIKAIEDLPNAYNGWSDTYDKAYIIGTLEEVPSADRPQGEWHFDEKGNFFCSECKSYPRSQYATTDFCPNCGAKMKSPVGIERSRR